MADRHDPRATWTLRRAAKSELLLQHLPLSHRNSIERDHYSTSTLATLGRLLALAGPWSAMGLALYNCEVEGREEHAGAPKAHPPSPTIARLPPSGLAF